MANNEVWLIAYRDPRGILLGSVEMSFEEAAESALFLEEKSTGRVGGIARCVRVFDTWKIEEYITLAAISKQELIQ